MNWLPGLESDDEPLPLFASGLAPRLQALAQRGIYLGTSSWKYEGWLSSIYSQDQYQTRGKFSQKKFESDCLRDYARVFPAVCGDFSFYQFPSSSFWSHLFQVVPKQFQFAFKVPEEITVQSWPRHARYGKRAGGPNENFLNAQTLKRAFLDPLLPYANQACVLIFEFGTFSKSAFPHPEAFRDRLAEFLDELPPGFRYAVEIRNPEYLGEPYFQTLADREVAHVFNAWTRMPEMDEQLAMPGAFTAPFTVARALLTRGMAYEQAVQGYSPYTRVQNPNPRARKALAAMIHHALRTASPAFLFVNNRLEGFSPGTIEGVLGEIQSD